MQGQHGDGEDCLGTTHQLTVLGLGLILHLKKWHDQHSVIVKVRFYVNVIKG